MEERSPESTGPQLVNDLGVDVTSTAYVLHGSSERRGVPLEVRLDGGELAVVIPAGASWQPIPTAGSGRAQKLWITPVGWKRPRNVWDLDGGG